MRAALALVDHIARPAEASGPALEFGTRGRSRPPGALPASCSAVVQEAIAGRAALYLPLAISSALFSRPPPPDSSRAAAARSLLCLRANRLVVISPDSHRTLDAGIVLWGQTVQLQHSSFDHNNRRQRLIVYQRLSQTLHHLPRLSPSPYICVQQPLTLILDKYLTSHQPAATCYGALFHLQATFER
jgi:hypothetical protein